MSRIHLPWPPAELSGHNNGNHFTKARTIKRHRAEAYSETKAARISVPATGDIVVSVDFFPPDNRSDRINFWNRMKPYFDGIADALGVNDKRFRPGDYRVHEPVEGGRVAVSIATPP